MPVTNYNAALGYNSVTPWDGVALDPLPALPPAVKPTTRHWLRVAFDSHATDTNYLWTDISSYLREDKSTPLSTRRGRQDTTQKFSVGKGVFVLDNRHLHFESLNSASPFATNLVPTKPVQSGEEYPWLPGLMPDGAFRDKATASLWTATNGTLTWNAPAHDLALGGLRMVIGTTGVFTSLLSPPVLIRPDMPNGPATASLRVDSTASLPRNVRLSLIFYSDTAGTVPITSFTSADVGVSQANRGQRVAIVAPAIPGTALSMRMQFYITSTADVVHGDNWYFIGAVLDYTAVSFFQETFTGYADSWVCTADDVGDSVCVLTASDTLKSLSLTPINSPFYGKWLASLNPTVWYRLGESGPQASVSTMAFKDQMGGPSIYCNTGHTNPIPPGTASLSYWGFPYGFTYYFFNNGPLPGVAGHSPIDPDLAFSFVGPSSQDRGSLVLGTNCKPTGTKWSYGFSFRSTNGQWHNNADLVATGGLFSFWTLLGINAAQLGTFPNQPHPSPGQPFVTVQVAPNAIDPVTGSGMGVNTNGGQLLVIAGIDGVAGDSRVTHQNVVVDELSHRIWITYDATGDILKIYVDGVLDNSFQPTGGMGINWTGLSAFNQLGDIQMIGADGDPGHFEMDEFMFFNGTVISPTTIATDYSKFRHAYPIQRSTERASAIFDLVNLPSTMRSVNTSAGVQLAPVDAPFFQANPLTYLQVVEDSELGLLFCDRSGRVVFVDHAASITGVYTTPQYTFGNGVGELHYESLVTSNDDTLFYTQGLAQNEKGSPQTFNTSLIANYFVRTIQKTGLLLDTDDKALAIATKMANLYSTLGTKIKSMTVYPEQDEATLVACSRIELGWMLSLKMRPTGVLLPTINVQVQGINQDVYRGKRRIVYDLSNVFYTT